MDEYTSIGHDVEIEVRYIDGEAHGVAYKHPTANGGICEGWAHFYPFSPSDSWIVESLDPLTISPSLLCGICGHHGFIKQGRWVPA